MKANYFIEPNASGIFCGMDKTARIDSRTVAEVFGKEHYNVLKAIENLEVSEEFNRVNFNAVKYKAKNGEFRKGYEMTRKGFTRLAFGFTGKKAAQFIEEYIERFDEMEELIRDKLAYLEDYPGFTDAIKYFKDTYSNSENEARWIYANEQDVVNVAVLGMTAKAFKKRYSIPDSERSIKPYLTSEQIKAVHKLQSYDVPFLVQGMPRDERIKQLTTLAKTLKLHIGTDVQEAELKKHAEESA